MPVHLQAHPSFPGRTGPVVVVVADGVGVGSVGEHNAVHIADTPTLDSLCASPLYTELFAHGTHVGLPSDSDIGNSEVGHNAIGAGRIFDQGAKLVNKAIADGSLFTSDLWVKAIEQAKGSTLHFLGLHSDGIVHSDIRHLHSMLKKAAESGVQSVRLHLLLDGRDVPERSALGYIEETETLLESLCSTYGVDYSVASGGGRMHITMDRYEADWEMVKRGYDVHVHGVGRGFSSAQSAVETLYSESDRGDQYLEPFVIVDNGGIPVGKIQDGDVAVLFNFRGDRAIEISQALEDPDFTKFDRGNHPDVFFIGMLEYDGDAHVPKNYFVDPPLIENTLSDYLCAESLKSFAVSETQKFGHVTYFWNGNRSGYVDASLEEYVEIPSDRIEFNKRPEMKYKEIAEATVNFLESGDFSFGRINFPNGDMVGHTGDLAATVVGVECVDRGMSILLEAVKKANGIIIYTADHGNADVMYKDSDGERLAVTSHTDNQVPFAIYDPQYAGEYVMADITEPSLGNIAATVCNLLGYSAPDDYLPSLISFEK